ncbi:aldehyde dehydrogenase family protein [Pseudomonas fulva]|nr:aldehyde dehydrogenase family protein [Pseudomonas fulva]MBF8781255.1 aldehyde dehydrogenase family protein [Pseudomonas fulva]
MTTEFPRVTYATQGEDLSALHDFLDTEIPAFRAKWLGRHWPNLIDGQASEQGDKYSAFSPIDNETLLGTFVSADTIAVDLAVQAARKQFEIWGHTSWQERIQKLRGWTDVLRRRKYEIAVACLLEIGKSRIEALGEADEVLDMVDYYCGEYERNNGYVQPLRREFPSEETSTRLRPIGVFGVIAPFNFPLVLSVNLIIGAILGGNTVVFKPSPNCGITANLLVDTLREAGLGHLVQLLAGHDECGKALVAHPEIDGIAFTGSYATGMAIHRELGKALYSKPLIAEMGGKNPAYVCASANLQHAARGVARSAFGLQGQKCSACSVVYVDNAVKEAFVEALIAEAKQVAIGDPQTKEAWMGPLYDADAAERFFDAVETARRDGSVLYGGVAVEAAPYPRGHYVVPAVVELPNGHPLVRDELFAPFVAVLAVSGLESAIALGNAVNYGLSAGIYTTDEAELQYFLEHAEAGALYANRPSGATTGAWPGVQSFCGWKGSGMSHKGGLGPNYLPQYMREQSHTIMR